MIYTLGYNAWLREEITVDGNSRAPRSESINWLRQLLLITRAAALWFKPSRSSLLGVKSLAWALEQAGSAVARESAATFAVENPNPDLLPFRSFCLH